MEKTRLTISQVVPVMPVCYKCRSSVSDKLLDEELGTMNMAQPLDGTGR